MASPEPTIIFLHIGKTAGSSLRTILRRQFRRHEILEFRPPIPPEGRLAREGWRQTFAAIPEADRARARLVMGHATYGVHELLPRPSTYITMLRDPVKLVNSLYHFIRRTPRHILHDALVTQNLSLEEFVTSGMSLETDNSQTRSVAGDTSTDFGACGPDLLTAAKAHLEERFRVVGLTERFDESLLMLGQAFGWTRLHYVSANVAPSNERAAPSPELIELIRTQNSLDVDLYAWAKDRLDRQIAADPTFEDSLARFRRANRRYRPWGRLTVELPRKAATLLSR
jgi:hypothetical protein